MAMCISEPRMSFVCLFFKETQAVEANIIISPKRQTTRGREKVHPRLKPGSDRRLGRTWPTTLEKESFLSLGFGLRVLSMPGENSDSANTHTSLHAPLRVLFHLSHLRIKLCNPQPLVAEEEGLPMSF